MYRVSSDWSGNATIQSVRQEQAEEILLRIVNVPVADALSGTLWIFPCAVSVISFIKKYAASTHSQGGVLILCAARAFLRHPPTSLTEHLNLGVQILTGSGLGLLGLLDIGSKKSQAVGPEGSGTDLPADNILYKLVSHRAPLAIILGVYAVVYYGGLVATGVAHRYERRRRVINTGAA